MKLKKLITTVVLITLSVTMAICATACFGGGATKYTVTLDANGGQLANDVTTVEVTFGESYTLPTPTKTGYVFNAWKNQEEVVETTGTWNIESDVTLKADWTVKTSAVTLDVAGGTGATETTLTATYGQVLSLPTLTKVGYTFAGWKLNGQNYDVTSAWSLEDATATIVATWTAKTTTVTLNVNEGVGATETTLTATYGQVLSLPTLTKDGYTFAGWTLNGNAYNVANAWSLEDATATLVANWTQNAPVVKTTTVTLELDGGTTEGETTLTATYGQVLVLPTVTKTGYTFVGWKLNGFAYNTANAWGIEAPTATLTAQWVAKTTTVTLNVNGGSGATETTLTATYGQVLVLPTLTKTGSNFAGWKLDGEDYDATSAWSSVATTATLTATWTAKTTTVTLDVAGGTGATETELTATYGQVLVLPTLTKTGYTFAGWTLNGNAYNVAYAWSVEGSTATLVATWNPKTTTVTLNLDGGSIQGETTITAKYGEILTLPTVTKTGYTFTGWKLDGQDYVTTNAWSIVESTATLTATWTAKTTTVTLDLDGGTIDGETTLPLTATYGKILVLPTVTKTNFVFVCWTLNGQNYDATSAWSLDAETATLVATWNDNPTVITIDENGGNALPTESKTVYGNKGQVLTLPTVTKTGYNLAGWTLNGEAYDVDGEWALEGGTAILVAQWTAKTTAVTLNLDGGSMEGENVITATYGVVLTLPTVTKTGYNLLGWTLKNENYVTTNAWSLEDKTATLTAVWAPKTTTVTLELDGGSMEGENVITAKYDEVLTLPTVTKTGYTLTGWKLNGQDYVTTDAWSLVDTTATLTAVWTAKTTTVTLNLAGGTIEGNTTLTATYGQVLTLNDPTKTGYTFAVWMLNNSAYDTASAWALEDASAELVATWTANEIPVTFNVNGGTAIEGTTFTFGQKPYENESDIPTANKDNYNFVRWLYNGQAIDLTQIWDKDVESIELVAEYVGITVKVTIKYDGFDVEASEQEVVFDGAYALKSTVAGYNISKLVIEDSETEVAVSGDNWAYSENVTLVATLAPKTYNVNIIGYNGEAIAQIVVTYGETVDFVSYAPSSDGKWVEGVGEMFFDGYRVEGADYKIELKSSYQAVWTYDCEGNDVTIRETYEGVETWI